MTIPAEILDRVRARANYACEYCGVSEVESGGVLTIDHYRPSSLGGSDDLDNLLYCCFRCNVFKADYWPEQPTDLPLWNPRIEPQDRHFQALADGTLHPRTEIGGFTIALLRLNRPQLVAHRRLKARRAEHQRLLNQIRDNLLLLESVERRLEAETEQGRLLLTQYRIVLQFLLDADEKQ